MTEDDKRAPVTRDFDGAKGIGPRGGKSRIKKTVSNKAQFDTRAPGAKLEAEEVEPAPGKPLLRWVGGKARIADEIIKRLPAKCERYVEPFVGGGAVFWAYRSKAQRALLCDLNAELINFYVQVQDAGNIGTLRNVHICADRHAEVDSEAHYNGIRQKFNDRFWASKDLQAGAFLYLNKSSYNGLYRTNKAGRYNTPWGKRTLGGKKLPMPKADSYVACWQALKNTELRVQDFQATLAGCGAGDAVYVDPPYPGTFDQYSHPKFDDETHRLLAEHCRAAASRGSHVVVSISDHVLSHTLYMPGVQRFAGIEIRTRIESLSVHHQVGPTAKERGKRGELVITITRR